MLATISNLAHAPTTGNLLGENGSAMAALTGLYEGVQPLLIPVALISGLMCIICWINPLSADHRVWTRKLSLIFLGVAVAALLPSIFEAIQSVISGGGSGTGLF
jgi:hypothetical protein